ncbi:TMEM175 family protein [Clavibacter michiganensis]|uniref:TMEM175 family protein n=1 Tax=Clavibacter michiganensis TaxID=28447 RepID=UPI000A3966A0|nr:TMEM175 family protein [Clavibacter michiganensis]MBE3077806.1 DUF1211 domain-containing protein [Clavibacter michiganensis subsp. michiganensis]MDO4024386.1 TMEM175 family protein [Clavibacter michiganensis]MDO4034345.1 TMEM175 family protein [Clavibacter michiganensis]MDO4046291.1 TMEM175 family protein [Clavibacter michiganensis]MDO4065432.1 TMEM175 family protein [Clavibacter michiganensis]
MPTARGLERLVAFSDAVVAIAITLVVLPLVDTARDGASDSVLGFLRENAAPLGAAAALSFVVIASLWQAHHSVWGRFTTATRGMMRVNFAWLAAIVFLPLPTVLIVGATSEDRLGVVIYIGTMVVATSSLAIVAELAHRAGAEDDAAEAATASLRRRRWIPAGLMALALVLAAAIPGVGTWALLVLLVAIPAERLGRPRASRG